MRSIQRPSPLPPIHPAGPLAIWLAPADSGQPPVSATTTNHREPHRHQPDLQHASAYPRRQTHHDLQPSGWTETLNRDHNPAETPPIPTSTPFTIWPRVLHYIHSGLAWFAGTFRRHRHKGYDRLGDAFTTLPSEPPRLQPLTHAPPGGGLHPPKALGARGGPWPPPSPCPSTRPAHTRARACAYARRALPGPGTPMDGPSSWPVPGDGPFLPKDIVNSTSKGR